MCRNCHKFYDLGYIGIFNGTIIKNNLLQYDYNISNKYIDNFNFRIRNIFIIILKIYLNINE